MWCPLHGENRMMKHRTQSHEQDAASRRPGTMEKLTSCRFATSGGVNFSLCPDKRRRQDNFSRYGGKSCCCLPIQAKQDTLPNVLTGLIPTGRQKSMNLVGLVSAIESNGLSSDRVMVVDGAKADIPVFRIVMAKMVQICASGYGYQRRRERVSVGSAARKFKFNFMKRCHHAAICCLKIRRT